MSGNINNNINEDYCSYLVSKLLKEKGFDNPSNYNFYYESLNLEQPIQCFGIDYKSHNLILAAPTHSLAIKWVRENYGIHISIDFCDIPSSKYYYNCYKNQSARVDLEFERLQKENEDYIIYNSPEEATEAALKYTLQNFIK